jgi:hypothetical protein
MKKRWLLGFVFLGLAISSQSLLANEQRKGLPQMILAQTTTTQQTTTPGATPTPTTTPTPRATPTPPIKNPASSNAMDYWFIIVFLVYGFVFLGLKGFEVFIHQKKMQYNLKVLNTHLEALTGHTACINKNVEDLTEEIRKQSEVNTEVIERKLNEKLPQLLEIEAITKQLSDKLNPIIAEIVQEKLEQQFTAIIPLIIEQLNQNPVFINTIAEVIAKKVSSSLPPLSSKTDIESNDNLSDNLDTSSLLTDIHDDNESVEDVHAIDDKTEDLTDEEKDIVDKYNRKNDGLKTTRKVLPVATNKDAVYGKMIGTDHLAVFTQSSEGVYWIIEGDNNFFYLVPNLDRVKTFNTQMILSMESIFTANNFKEGVTNAKKFTLVKPAKVSVTKAGEEWTLVENGKGVLDFK